MLAPNVFPSIFDWRNKHLRARRIYSLTLTCPEANLELIVIIVLVLLLFGSFPIFPYSRNWGYRGSGALGTILIIVLLLYLLKVI